MPPPKIIVTLAPTVHIDPIPTGAGGIVRGTTITLKRGAACVKEIIDTAHPDNDTSEPVPELIPEVAVAFDPPGTLQNANRTRHSGYGGDGGGNTHDDSGSRRWILGNRQYRYFKGSELSYRSSVFAQQERGSRCVSSARPYHCYRCRFFSKRGFHHG
jgi:hypothetical protein